MNLDKLSLLSRHPADMIVQHDTITIFNDGNTTGQPTTYQEAKVVTDSHPNLYGRAALARARWSIDGGTNWQSMESRLVYTFNLPAFGVTLYGLDSAISIGCNDSTVFFRTANGRHGDVVGNPPSVYTPTPRTFLIEYWLYERG